MKSIQSHIICLCFLLSFWLFAKPVLGQTRDSMVFDGVEMVPWSSIPVDTILFDLNEDLAKQMKPLDSVLVYAINYSPVLKFEEASIKKAKYNLNYTRYLFLNGFSGFYNYTYGNQTNLNTIGTDGGLLNNSLGVGYRAGLNVTIPFTEVFARPARIKQLKAEHEMSKYKRAEAEIELRRKIITDYYNLMAAQKMMNVRVQDVESARLTVEIANIEMRRGKIHPSELSRLKNVLAIAEANLEMSKRDFMIYYYDLETMVGVKLHFLKRVKLISIPTPQPDQR